MRLCAAIDEERRQLFESLGTMYEGYFVLTVTYFPPVLAQTKFVELMFDDDAIAPDHKARTQRLDRKLQARVREHRIALVRRGEAPAPARSQVRHRGWLGGHSRRLSPLAAILRHRHESPCPVADATRCIWTPSSAAKKCGVGWCPRSAGSSFRRSRSKAFPLESTPGILTALGELPCEYRWSSRFIFMDTHEAVKHLDKFRKKWRQKIRGFFDQVFNTNSGPIDQDALSMVADAEAAIAEVNSGLVAQGYYTSVVILMDEDRGRLEASARQVEKAINRLGFAARIETINTMDAYLGSLPGHGVENVRRPLINTMNLADLLPTSTIWTGSNSAPCPMYPPLAPPLMHCVTHGSTPFRLNLHVRDLGHTFMFGPTGAGKSTHLAVIAAQLRRYAGMSIFAFDKGMSMYPLAAAIRAIDQRQHGQTFHGGGR